MILGLLIYGTTVALVLTLGGLALEPIAARLGLPRRGVWAGALLLSIAVPAIMVMTPHAPAVMGTDLILSERALPFRGGENKPAPPANPSTMTPVVPRPASGYRGPSLDRIVGTAWLAISAGVAGILTLSWIRIRRLRSQWRRTTVDDLEVWVTPEMGPAVLGFFRPQILIPQWVMDASAAMRSIILVHEREHIDSRDPLLLFSGFLVVTLAPWNLPLWWQLRKLRFAVEVDCDARVLRNGAPLSTYGEVLLTVSQRGHLAPLGAMAIAKPQSQLERRIRLMALPASRSTRWLVGAAATLAAVCVALAVEVPAPALRDADIRHLPLHDWSPYSRMAEASARAAYPELFRGEFDGTVVIVVDFKRDGSVLSIQKRNFPSGPLPENARLREIDTIDFVAERDGNNDGAGGHKFMGWFGPQRANGLYLDYAVMKWPHDPARSATRVRAAVASEYPDYFRSYPPAYAYQEQTAKLLTVFMNDDGTINRSNLGDVWTIGAGDTQRYFFNRIVALGLQADQFGLRGWTFNTQDPDRLSPYPNAPRLDIVFAWPRHPDDPPDIVFQSHPVFNQTFEKSSEEINRRVPDELFLKRYFPDIWEHGPTSDSDQAWILVDVDGVVCDTGRIRAGDLRTVANELSERYPGARIGLDIGVGAETATSRGVNLSYMRLEDDSPFLSCQAIAKVRQTQ